MKKLKFIIVFIFCSIPLFAQDFEGVIVYKISYADLPAEMKGAESMMPKSQTFYIKKLKSKYEMVTPIGVTTVFNDSENNTSTVLLDAMQQKFKITFTSEDLNTIDTEKTAMFTVTYTEEVKNIAGYLCKKAIVNYKTKNQRVEVFYTKDIQPMDIKGLEGIKIDGMPLEYTIITEEMSMKVTVEKIEKMTIDDSVFLIPEGYQEMPQSMKKMFKNR